MTDACKICGLSVSRGSVSTLVQKVKGFADQGEGAWILTLNTEMLARGARHSSYWNLLKKADIITADGMPLVWASKFKCPNDAVYERTTGVDLVDALLQLDNVPRFAVIGGKDPMKTVQRYGQRAMDACVFLYDGQVDFSDNQIETFVNELVRRETRVLFIALGVPKQDQLALELRQRMPSLVIMGVGGTFEILGPQGHRAPHWMRQVGLEWLYRLSKEPGRLWRRYLLNYPRGIWFLLKDCLVPAK